MLQLIAIVIVIEHSPTVKLENWLCINGTSETNCPKKKQKQKQTQHKLVNFVSSNVQLAKSKLVVVLVIQNVHQVCVERVNILPLNNSNIVQFNILNKLCG